MDQTPTQRLEELLNKSSLSEEEIHWLYQYVSQSDTPELRRLLLEKFADDLAGYPQNGLPSVISEKMLQEIRLKTSDRDLNTRQPKRFRWERMAVAATILTVISATFFLLLHKEPRTYTAKAIPVPRTDVAAPVTTRATIILGDGRRLVLDSSNNGMLAWQGEVGIKKTDDGSIVYQGSSEETIYNTLFNPRGSKPVSLTLSDGSKVWLNSESSLRYPTAFTNKERMVEITGEAYFEVTKNKLKPFRVSVAGKGMVEVLGTHFNINSYGDEANTRITLLEGSIKVTVPNANSASENNERVIGPGQQAMYTNTGNSPAVITVKNKVDLDAVIAWKNGYFNFDDVDLYHVMRQLSRWYNIRVKYEGKLQPREFGGEMQRDLNLSEVLKLLEKNNVHFTIENDRLVVRP